MRVVLAEMRTAPLKKAAIGVTLVVCLGCRTATAPQPPAPKRVPSGAAEYMGGLRFDPLGADFTRWVKHFKNEVYRNWIVPQTALSGVKGGVDFEFRVERDGSVSALRTLKSSGTPELDRAAQNALQGSRFLPLPSDYPPPRITMQVTFFYNQGPRGSN